MLSNVPYLVWVLVLGLVLRLVNLNQSLWLDEATSILAASRFSHSEIIHQFSPGDFHPPVYYLFLKIWLELFGTSEVAARSLSVFFGTSTIYLVYSLTNKLFNTKTALVAALLLATAPLHIYYSQEARMYVLETLLAVKIMQLVIAITHSKQTAFTWISLFAFSALLLYTDYLPAAIFSAIGLYLVCFEREILSKYLAAWLGLLVGLVVVYLPWLPVLKLQLTVGALVKTNAPLWWETLGRTDFKQLSLVPLKFAVGRVTSYNKVLYYGLSAIPIALYCVVLVKGILAGKKTTLVWLWFVVPLGIAGALGLYLSVFSYFRFLFILPAFYILAAVGAQSFGKLGRNLVFVLVTCNIIASMLYLTNPRFHREDWRSGVSWIEQHSLGAQTASVFVANNQRDPYFYYAKTVPSYGPIGWEEGDFSKIWLFRYVQPIFDPKDDTRQKIESLGYKKADERDFNGITIWEYVK